MEAAVELANRNIRNRKRHIFREYEKPINDARVLVVADAWSCWGSFLTANLRSALN